MPRAFEHFPGATAVERVRLLFLQELQKAYDKRKPIVLSINLCSNEFVRADTAESRQLQAKLKDMNNHWDGLGSSLEEWRASLQEALMQCQVGRC